MSTAPSASSMYDQKSPYARERQQRRISVVKSSSWPRSSHPCREEYDSEASSSRRTSETWQRLALSNERPVQAPLPFDAHQRRFSSGADTTPSTTSSSTTSEISVAHTGTPRTKFLVPSIGSITQRRWLWPVEPCSSPVTASRERTRDSVRRMLSSTAWSASVTGVRSGLLITCRSSALNRLSLIESASSASTCASRRSSV